jgi:hypothetical protein
MINSFKILFSLIKTIIEKNEEEKINLLRFYILNEFQTCSKQGSCVKNFTCSIIISTNQMACFDASVSPSVRNIIRKTFKFV